jgi:hypothetical protein
MESAYWKQDLSFSIQGNFTNEGFIQTTTQWTKGQDISSSGYTRQYSYPLDVLSSSEEDNDNVTLTAVVGRGLDLKTYGPAVFPTGHDDFAQVSQSNARYAGAWLLTTQNGTATYMANMTTKKSSGFGTAEQVFRLSGISSPSNNSTAEPDTAPPSEELYYRHAIAVNGSIIQDSGRQ